ncbi:hypothetical protein EJ04DRAFT_513067 [Polyplosphaeria fusca]|uniref:Xylanolytic transcriptional activator regulatory domain-containing protein n=1 Tax=Polyplosphaeria fusca TaxID=682080 RepID=A0A9P4V1Y2_9PLEO|nr:hypothetical protein EJ04DRAFT_513067 [Polyplosphaeria fusca]
MCADETFTDAVAAQIYVPGYLGPTSYDAILPQDEDPSVSCGRAASEDLGPDQEMSHQHPFTKAMRTQMTTDVLKSLRYYPVILEAVVTYYTHCQAGVVAGPLVIQAVKALAQTVDKYNLTNTSPAPELVSKVLENTGKPLHIPPDITADDFHTLFTGDNLRLEILSQLLATAGRAVMFGLSLHVEWSESFRRTFTSKFIDEMLRNSTTCLVLCTLTAPVHDITIWMFHESTLFCQSICGFTSPPLWRRMGELATQLYALGLHREPKDSELPLFVLETRRKLFCASYVLDKSISTLLGRPLRMSKRHTDITLPLDLSDEELTSADPSAAIQALDADGWNTRGDQLRVSWIRYRYISSRFREEILDFALAKLDSCVETQLLDISRRSNAAREAMPAHMQYTPRCWEDESLPRSACLMLVNVHLYFLYNEFMIQKLLTDAQRFPPNTALLRVCTDMLSIALVLAQVRDRSYDIHRDVMHTVVLYGIPTGAMLATALKQQHASGTPFPAGISRSEIIRMLSVLINHLDTAAHLDSGARPGDGNYNICRKYAKTFTRMIDAVLDAGPAAAATASETTASTSAADLQDLSLDLDFDFLGGTAMDGFEGFDLIGGGLYDNADWGAAAGGAVDVVRLFV